MASEVIAMRPRRSALLLASAWLVTGLLGASLFAGRTRAEEPKLDPAQLEFFEKRVRPVLVASCQKCHGPEKQENHFRVDSLEALIKGGDTAPAVVPGKPEESLLVGAINHGEIVQ